MTGFAAILGRYGRTRRKDAGCRTDGRSVSWAGVGRRKRQIEWPLVALRGEGAQMREWRERGGSQSEGKGEKGGTTRRRERRDRRQGVGPRVRTDAGGSEGRTGGLSLERVPPIVLGACTGKFASAVGTEPFAEVAGLEKEVVLEHWWPGPWWPSDPSLAA